MAHNNVSIFVESRYKVNRKRINAAILRTLKEQEVVTPVDISLAIVGNRKMRSLNKKYRNLDKTTNVLSFSLNEGENAILPPKPAFDTDVWQLGDVVLSYPQIIKEAAEGNILVDDKVDELVSHGLLHLLGIHH